MADPREFVLIGSFRDGISPGLEKINKQISDLKANFAGVGSRKNSGFRGATKEIGKLVSANKNLTKSFREVQSSVSTTTGTLKKYITVLNKATAANKNFQKSGGNLGASSFARNMRDANREAERYLRTLEQINRTTPRSMRPPRSVGGGGAAGTRQQGGGGFFQDPFAEFGFSYVLGSQLSNTIQTAIIGGFRIGVDLMQKPFQYFASNFGERMQDELSDLKAAGGFFSIAQNQKENERFIKSFDEAVDFTQENNKVLAKLAAALPGSTQDYIEISKRISDSVARTVIQDKGNAIKYAEELRKAEPTVYGTGPVRDEREAIQVMLGELTKQTVLAGQGGRTGAGGAMGAYGLPQLTERMISSQDVSLGQFQRYSAIFSDPMIMDALAKEIPNINKTAANTVERFKAIQELYKRVLPPELIERYRRTLAGVQETFNTAIFGPETGLFGLGRKMEGLGNKFNEFGQVVTDASGKIVKAELSIYDLVRDVIANIGQIFGPIVENITLLYDPLKGIGEILAKARNVSAKLLESFNYYLGGFKDIGFEGGEAGLRASLTTIANLLRTVGAIGKGDFSSIVNQLKGKDVDFAGIMKGLIDKLLNSKVALKVGETIGQVIGTVLKEVSGVTGFISGRIEKSNQLFKGLKEGFESSGGLEAIGNIFRDVFRSLINLVGTVVSKFPMETAMFAGVTLLIPALAQGLGMLIGHKLLQLPGMLAKSNIAQRIFDTVKNVFTGVKPANVRDLGSRITDPSRMLPAAGQTGKAGALVKAKTGPIGGFLRALSKARFFFKQLWKAMTLPMKALGKLNVGFGLLSGAIEFVTKLFTGGDLFQALGSAAGVTIGTMIGGALLGPLGAMIGGWIGGLESVTEPLTDALRAIFGTLKTTFDLVMQIGKDLIGLGNGVVSFLNWLISKIPGVGNGFDLLRAAMFALLSPFKMLEIAMNGLYDLYLWVKSKTVGVSAEERAVMNERRTQRATDEFTIMGREAAGHSLAEQKSAEYAKFLAAKAAGDTEAMNRTAEYMKSINRMIEQRGGGEATKTPAKSAPAVTPTKPAIGGVSGLTPTQADMAWYKQAVAGSAAAPPPTAPEVKATADNTLNLNAKAAQQITQSAQTHQVTQEVKTNTLTANSILGNIKSGVISLSNKLTGIAQTLSQAQASMTATYMLLASGSLSVRTPDMAGMGGMFGMGGGGGMALGSGYGSAGGAIAGKLGDFMKSTGGAPGSIHEHPAHGGVKGKHSANSYHYQGRAIDIGAYAHEQAGVISRIQQFNQKMGVKPVEFLHAGNDPNHQDHVHVAYALGKGNPAFFSSQRMAERWESQATMGSVKVSSITGNSAEGFGSSPVTIEAPITINQQPGQDAEELAAIVAYRIANAVREVRDSNIFA